MVTRPRCYLCNISMLHKVICCLYNMLLCNMYQESNTRFPPLSKIILLMFLVTFWCWYCQRSIHPLYLPRYPQNCPSKTIYQSTVLSLGTRVFLYFFVYMLYTIYPWQSVLFLPSHKNCLPVKHVSGSHPPLYRFTPLISFLRTDSVFFTYSITICRSPVPEYSVSSHQTEIRFLWWLQVSSLHRTNPKYKLSSDRRHIWPNPSHHCHLPDLVKLLNGTLFTSIVSKLPTPPLSFITRINFPWTLVYPY